MKVGKYRFTNSRLLWNTRYYKKSVVYYAIWR